MVSFMKSEKRNWKCLSFHEIEIKNTMTIKFIIQIKVKWFAKKFQNIFRLQRSRNIIVKNRNNKLLTIRNIK